MGERSGDGMEGQGRKRVGWKRGGERVGREREGEEREGEGKGQMMWRGPESGLPRGPRWLSTGLAISVTGSEQRAYTHMVNAQYTADVALFDCRVSLSFVYLH